MPFASEMKSTPATRKLRKRGALLEHQRKNIPQGAKALLGIAFSGGLLGFSNQGGELEKRRNQMNTFETSCFVGVLWGCQQ